MIVLITGGSGCGKSTYAEKLVSTLEGCRYYIATMQVYDDESVKRVERHRLQRKDKGFETIECEKNLADVLIPDGSTVLIEDLVNLVANEMFDGGNVECIPKALKTLCEKCTNVIMVTNDIFSDGIIYSESTQAYLKALSKINSVAAELSDSVIEVVYSIPIPVKGVLPCV